LVCIDKGGGAGGGKDKAGKNKSAADRNIGNFSNEGSCLLISEASVESVRRRSEATDLKRGGGACSIIFYTLPLLSLALFAPMLLSLCFPATQHLLKHALRIEYVCLLYRGSSGLGDTTGLRAAIPA
jgi:hypothetical protein